MSDNPVTARQPRSDAGQVRATEKDRQALAWVMEMYAMPRDLLAEVLGVSSVAIRDRLLRWRRAGWVEDAKLDSGPGWVWGTRRGIDMFGEHPYATTPPSVGKLAHLRAVIEERRIFETERADRQPVFRSERAIRWELGQQFGAAAVRTEHVPDGEFTLTNTDTGGRFTVAFEVELTPKSYARVEQNIQSNIGRFAASHWIVEHRAVRPLFERWLHQAEPGRPVQVIDRETREILRPVNQRGGT